MVLLNNTGVALTGSANIATLAQRGLQAFCPVDEAGNATTMGAVILVSNTTVLDTATIGSNVGALSVAGGTGTYTFTLTSNPGSLFATAGTNGVNLNVAAALTAGIKPITVQAAGGVPTPISRTINITVTQSPTLPVNTVAPVIAGTPQEGQTLTVTNNGTWTGFPAPAFSYQWNRNPLVSAEASQWLARAPTLDATHIAADTAFINGLVADGDWASFDIIRCYATQSLAIGLLNMVQNNYNGTANGPPAFTADRGPTGVTGSSTVYVNSGFNPATAVSPKYTQNSAHLSLWCLTDPAVNADNMGVNNVAHILPRWNTNTFYGSANGGFSDLNTPNTVGLGWYVVNRSASNAQQAYRDGNLLTSSSAASVAVPNFNMYELGQNNAGAAQGASAQLALVTYGSTLSAAAVTRVWNRIRTRMTAVGVP
jgi:hypothetical protein